MAKRKSKPVPAKRVTRAKLGARGGGIFSPIISDENQAKLGVALDEFTGLVRDIRAFFGQRAVQDTVAASLAPFKDLPSEEKPTTGNPENAV